MTNALDWYCLLWGIASATANPVLPEDLKRFPDPQATVATRLFIEEHRDWLRAQRGQEGLDENDRKVLRVWNWENDRGLAAWSRLEWCHGVGNSPERAALVAHLTYLRQTIGWEAYVNGRMPAPVPFWRFERVP